MKLAAISVIFAGTLAAQSANHTFISPDGVFRFQYQDPLLTCSQRQTDRDSGNSIWQPEDSCTAYIPVCDEGDPRTVTLVCMGYSKAALERSQTFTAAAFSVARVRSAATKTVCLAGSRYWANVPLPSTPVRIGGTEFMRFPLHDAGLSHYMGGTAYRVFHRGACYQLSLRTSTTNPGVFDPPAKPLTPEQSQDIDRTLQYALESFRFLR